MFEVQEAAKVAADEAAQPACDCQGCTSSGGHVPFWDEPDVPDNTARSLPGLLDLVSRQGLGAAWALPELARLDPERFSPVDQVEAARVWAQLRAQLDALLLGAVRAFTRSGPSRTGDGREFPWAELAPALGVGTGTAGRLIVLAADLDERLPATAAALRAGRIDLAKAHAIADSTNWLSDELAGKAEQLILARTETYHQSAAAVRSRLCRIAARLDPAGHRERARQEAKDFELVIQHQDVGVSELFARLDPVSAQIVWTAADASARRFKAAGDPRSLPELRVTALVDWASQFLTTGRIVPIDQDAETPRVPGGDEPVFLADDPGATPPADPDVDASDVPSVQARLAWLRAQHGPIVWPDDLTEPTDCDREQRDKGDGARTDAGRDSGSDPRGAGATTTDVADPDAADPDAADPDAADPDAPATNAAATNAAATGAAVTEAATNDDAASLAASLVATLSARLASAPTTDAEAARTVYWLSPPLRHGRPVTVNITIPYTALTGRTESPGELDTGQAFVPAEQIRAMLPGSVLRRLLHEPLTGHLVDISRGYRVPAAMADAVCVRDHTPMTPSGSTAAPSAGDLDHIIPYADGGLTTAANLTVPTRNWHTVRTPRKKRADLWKVRRNRDGSITWTSPQGRRYTLYPYDYRDGP